MSRTEDCVVESLVIGSEAFHLKVTLSNLTPGKKSLKIVTVWCGCSPLDDLITKHNWLHYIFSMINDINGHPCQHQTIEAGKLRKCPHNTEHSTTLCLPFLLYFELFNNIIQSALSHIQSRRSFYSKACSLNKTGAH